MSLKEKPIGAAARALGMSAQTIRYYEHIGLILLPSGDDAGWVSPG